MSLQNVDFAFISRSVTLHNFRMHFFKIISQGFSISKIIQKNIVFQIFVNLQKYESSI